MERTYVGPLPRGTVTFPDDTTITFTRGVPVEVSTEQGKALSDDPDWKTPGSKAAQNAPTPPEETS